VEERWQQEDGAPAPMPGASPPADLGQLDLLLQEIRADRQS
jgi:hypothetical protein